MLEAEPGGRETRTTMRVLQHDARTPLGQILGYSEMLEEELRDRGLDELVPDLEHIRSAAHSLLELVDGIFRPERSPDPVPVEPANRSVEAAHAQGGHSGRLLVVDDEPANRELLCRWLSRAGFDVTAAAGGRAALAMVDERHFDLVLLDVMMPDLDGVETLRAIRHRHSVATLPVIMATALSGSAETVAALESGANDYVTKPFDVPVVVARINTHLALRAATQQVEGLAQQLEIRNAFLRRTFGRYLSDEVVSNLLEHEGGLELGGERRRVTVLFCDLRGFTSLTEALAPTEIVTILNGYLAVMSDVIHAYHGTVDEFIGDAVLALFGALTTGSDDAERAVACAVAMQLALVGVNREHRERGLPEVQMGIGIATGEVIVGNVGSERRSKHTAIGSAVNLASRIEGYTLGGEILVSQSTFDDVAEVVRVDRVREVWPKGFESPLAVHRIAAVDGRHRLVVPSDRALFAELVEPIAIRFALLEGKSVSGRFYDGQITALSTTGARIRAELQVPELTELRIELLGAAYAEDVCYAKVVDPGSSTEPHTVRFSTRSGELVRRATPSPS